MKYSNIFLERIQCKNSDEVFAYLIDNLRNTITTWEYFVNWSKVFGNIEQIEVDLNILNYLIGKDDIEKEFSKLLKKHPSIYNTIPIIIACRQSNFDILAEYNKEGFVSKKYSFAKESTLTKQQIDDAVEFANGCGFLDLLKNKRLKSIVDYVIGVEVGLDSNGRKNRGGTMMEEIVGYFIDDMCQRNNYEYIPEATSSKVMSKWGIKMTVDKSSRRVDYAVYNGKFLYLIETNFYSGGGSKLKSTAGEYTTMYDYWKNDGHKFIWISVFPK